MTDTSSLFPNSYPEIGVVIAIIAISLSSMAGRASEKHTSSKYVPGVPPESEP